MCGRYSAPGSKQLAPVINEWRGPELPNQYNLAPTEQGPTIRLEGNRHVGQAMRWGFLPDWAGSLEDVQGYSMINARAETAHEKRSFKRAFREQRCLIPAYGFFEWQKTRNGRKQPYHIRAGEGQLIYFAGLWNEWTPRDDPESGPLLSYTILVQDPAPEIAVLHDRMPVVLAQEVHEDWLDPDRRQPEELHDLIRAGQVMGFDYYPVSRWMSNPRHKGRRCIEPLPDDAAH